MSVAILKIGVSGGVGSGKSAVSAVLAGLGAAVIDADLIAVKALADPGTVGRLLKAFGQGILDREGRVDRGKLAAAAFSTVAGATALNAATHPFILDRMRAAEREAAESGAKAIVLDAPLLFEAGLAAGCDVLVYVDAPPEVRKSRASARGLPPDEWRRREQAQGDLDEKRRASGVVIDNSGPMERTRAQVEAFFSRRLAPPTGAPESGGPAMR